MIMVARQMKNINYMYMTPWLVLHAAINLEANQLACSYKSQSHYLSH